MPFGRKVCPRQRAPCTGSLTLPVDLAASRALYGKSFLVAALTTFLPATEFGSSGHSGARESGTGAVIPDAAAFAHEMLRNKSASGRPRIACLAQPI